MFCVDICRIIWEHVSLYPSRNQLAYVVLLGILLFSINKTYLRFDSQAMCRIAETSVGIAFWSWRLEFYFEWFHLSRATLLNMNIQGNVRGHLVTSVMMSLFPKRDSFYTTCHLAFKFEKWKSQIETIVCKTYILKIHANSFNFRPPTRCHPNKQITELTHETFERFVPWTSSRKIVSCASAGITGNVFPATAV